MAAHLFTDPISLTVKQAAEELGCSPSFIYKLMRLGELAYEKRGRFKRPLIASVHEYRQRNIVPAKSDPPMPGVPWASGYQFKHLFQKKKTAPEGRGGQGR